jgi:cytoskeletal protein CcmA (bactofilin family)
MFHKPIIPNLNDSVGRKDVRTVHGTTNPAIVDQATRSTQQAAEKAMSAPPLPAIKEAASNTEDIAGARLIVGPDVKLKGAEILDCDTLVVEGRVEATMDSRVVRIAELGSFSGKVSIDIAEIHGSFDGELTARSQLIIHATGKVSGKIRYGKLVIAEGGELCGDINALSAEKSSQNRQRTEHVPTLSAIVA